MSMILITTFGLGQPTFTEHTISNIVNGAWFVYAKDMDTDGDMDVLSASFSDDKIAWYKNDGNENFTDFDMLEIADRVISAVNEKLPRKEKS